MFKYGEEITLTGQLRTLYYLGRPGYGESPELDELEHAAILILDEPISVRGNRSDEEGDYDSIDEPNVTEVQILSSPGEVKLFDLRGHGIEFTGHLFHAHTGHHHTRVLLDARESPPRVVDDRNTYRNARIKQSGSGFFIDSQGHVATNAHVVAGFMGVTVTRGLFRGKATVELCDLENDIAILRTSILDQSPPPIRSWMGPQLGETIFVFGFPFRPTLPHSLNMGAGIVSSEIGIVSSRFQISAPIQKGNSGGPVFDRHGNVLGVVRGKLNPIRDNQP